MDFVVVIKQQTHIRLMRLTIIYTINAYHVSCLNREVIFGVYNMSLLC